MDYFHGLNFGATINVLDSEQDKKALFGRINAQLPIPPDIKLKLTAETYLLMCGWKIELQALPIPDGILTIDILNETLAVTVGGPIIPHSALVICGKELWNIPNGAAGFLGRALVQAILDVFF